MRTRTKGIRRDGEVRILDKQYRGQRIFDRLGAVTQEEAEAELRRRQDAIDVEQQVRESGERLWADGARKYLMECARKEVRTLDQIAYHVELLLPYIGDQPLGDVCNDSLETFKLDRSEDGVKNATINRSLEVVRTVLNRAARVWRDNRKPWLPTAPLIELLDEEAQARKPYPISWAEQALLFSRLPRHLEEMAEFAVNTGARDENVCGLRWEWERHVPELGRSVFVIPPEHYKAKRKHVLVLNDTAWNIVERQRGKHDVFVFVYRRERVKNFDKAPVMKYDRIATVNNNGWQQARKAVGLPQVRVHDLRHTFGQRLRDAGVSEEDRALLLGHSTTAMPQHYAAATVAKLVAAANQVNETLDRTTLLRVANG